MIAATGYALIILSLTVLCGAPFVYHLNKNNNIITKLSLSFVIGYTLLSLTGLLANIVGTNPFFAQLLILFLSAVSFFVLARNRFSGIKFKRSDTQLKTIWIRGRLETEDKLVLVFGLIYLLGCLYFFDSIIMWMGGDAQGHASIIRYLLDGASVPVSVYPFGTNWECYPKAFHLYSYFWASLLPIGMVRLIQAVPVIVTTVTSLLVYSVVRESGKREIALYAFVIACFCFVQHSAFLIWAGYPAGAAEMLLVGIVLAILVDRRFLPLLIVGIAFTHTRFLVYCAAIVFVWMGVECIFRLFRGEWKTNSGDKTNTKTKKHLAFYSVVTVAGIVISIIISFILIKTGILQCNAVHSPIFLTELATNRELTVEYIARWYPAVLSVVGMVVAAFKRDKLDRIVFAWFGGIIAVVILVDTGLLDLPISVDRAFTKLYVPLSILAAYPIYAVQRYLTVTNFANSNKNKNKNDSRSKDKGRDKDRKQMRVVLVLAIMLLLIGGVSTGVVFKSYVDPWAIPEADYRAMVWMNEQRFDNAICINLDTVGRWIYPFTGIPVSNPRSVPRPDVTREGQVIGHPNDAATLDSLYNDSMRYEHVLLYVSNVTNTRPGHKPPFSRSHEYYPNVNVSNFNATFYDLIYGRDNAYVFEYKLFCFAKAFTNKPF